MAKHPQLVERARLFFARFSIFRLILMYFFAVILLSALFGLLYLVSQPQDDPHTYYYWFQQALAVLSTVGASGIEASEAVSFHSITHLIASAIGLLLPALFITAVINKLLIPNKAFVFRNRVAVYDDPRKGAVAAIRFYNGTGQELSDVQYRIYARVPYLKPNGEKALKNTLLAIHGKGLWPFSKDRVPFTAYVKLLPDHFDKSLAEQVFLSGDGEELHGVTEIAVFMSATQRDSQSTIYDSYIYSVPADLHAGPFGDVDVNYDKPPTSWSGWDKFDHDQA